MLRIGWIEVLVALLMGAPVRLKDGRTIQLYKLPERDGNVLDPSLFGFDFSKWQGAIDFAQVFAYGAKFIILRCAYAITRDERFLEYINECLQYFPNVTSVYHYYDPRYHPIAQADEVIEILNSYKGRIRRVWGDFEFYWSGSYEAPSHWKVYAERIIAAGYEFGVYTRKTWWDSRVGTLASWFGQFPLWAAQYSLALTLIPAGWTRADLWQKGTPAKGAEVGTESLEVDYNIADDQFYLNEYEYHSNDIVTYPLDGIKQIQGNRFGCRVYINIIDPQKVRFEVRNEDGYPSQISNKYGAQIAWNGDDWHRDTRLVKDNYEPSLLIFSDKTFSIGNWKTSGELHHSSGLRYLVENGQNVIPANGTEPKYTERHARSIIGKTRSGHLFHLTVDGDQSFSGMLLYECAQVSLEFDCLMSFDQGGGGDSVEVLNGRVVNVPDDGYERKVPQTILGYAQESNMHYLELDPIDNTSTMSIRADHPDSHIQGGRVGVIPAGTLGKATPGESYIYPADKYVSGILRAKAGDIWHKAYYPLAGWVAEIHLGVRYMNVREVGAPTEPPPTTLPDLPFRFEIGDDVLYVKQVIEGVLKPK